MPFVKFDFEEITKERRESIAKTIRTASADELKKLGDQIFPYVEDPWREAFFGFIAQNPGATFHYAVTSDGGTLFTAARKTKVSGLSREPAKVHCRNVGDKPCG